MIIGFGPCGILAALLLAQMGLKPIVLERGQDVRQRTQDTWGLWRKRKLKVESNVQFGEGGAGTFSDGKLWSQIKDPRHLGRKVMLEFVKAGAPEEILLVSKPHIGTFKLVKVVEHIREQIIALGGEIRFEQRVSDVLLAPTADGQQLTGLQVLAIQHINQAVDFWCIGVIDRCQTNRTSLAISRSDQHLLALTAMPCNERRDRLRINARMAQRQGDHGRCPCDLTERISGNRGELSRKGGAAQGGCDFARGKARDKDRMCTARPGGLNQSRELWAGNPRGCWRA